MGKKSKKKKPLHASYNKKLFLAPESINSMSAIHAKIKTDGIAILRISDCHNSIRIWNDFNDRSEQKEMIDKLENLMNVLKDFHSQVVSRYNHEFVTN